LGVDYQQTNLIFVAGGGLDAVFFRPFFSFSGAFLVGNSPDFADFFGVEIVGGWELGLLSWLIYFGVSYRILDFRF
jgi:hypothetical protein